MKTNKKWIQKTDRVSEFYENETALAAINRKTLEATINFEVYKIRSSGIFSQKISLEDFNSKSVIEIKPEHWYSHSYSFQFNNETYKIIVRNNPLAEILIKKGNEECLAYGLDILNENKKIAVRINESNEKQPLEFHVLLWYLFEPVARENTIDFQWWMWGIS
jgi:hypothetical protein